MKIPKFSRQLLYVLCAGFLSANAHADWRQIPGAAKDIGVGANGSAWVIGANPVAGGFGIYRDTGNGWQSIPGGAVRIDVDPQGNPWAVNDAGNIYRFNGQNWAQLPGGAKDIGVGANGVVWIVGTNPVAGGFGLYRLEGNNWRSMPGGAVRIDVDPQGNPWVVNAAGNIYRFNGQGWQQMPGAAKDVGIGADGSVFVIGTDEGIYRWNGNNWDKQTGAGSNVSVDNRGRPWVVNNAGNIYLWETGQGSSAASNAPAGASGGGLSGTDPVDMVTQRVPQANAALGPLKGIFSISEAEAKSPDDRSQLFKLKGKFDWARGVNQVNSPFSFLARNAATLAQRLGAPGKVPMEVTLYDKNSELDLELSFQIADTWRVTGAMTPLAETRFAFNQLNLKLHAKMNKLNMARSFSVEAEGKMFSQPTVRDPWLGLTPVVEVDNEGSITFGGEISGACGGMPSQSTEPGKDCGGEWNVLRLGTVRSKGGVLKLSVAGGVVKGVEAAIKEGKFGPSNIPVDGAVLVDADLTPGFGVVLKTRGNPSLKDVLAVYRPLADKVPPFGTLLNGMNKLPNPNIPVSGAADIIITPTGLTVGHIDIPTSTIRVNADANAAGVTLQMRSDLQGDIDKILQGDASGLPSGYMRFNNNFDSVNNAVKSGASKIPGIGVIVSKAVENFAFNGVGVQISINGFQRTGTADAYFTLVGSQQSVSVPLDAAFDPTSIAGLVLNKASDLVGIMPQWLKDGIGKIPGGSQVLNGVQYAGGKVVGFAKDAGNAIGNQINNNVNNIKNNPAKVFCLGFC